VIFNEEWQRNIPETTGDLIKMLQEWPEETKLHGEYWGRFYPIMIWAEDNIEPGLKLQVFLSLMGAD